jgi:hypothetical protein
LNLFTNTTASSDSRPLVDEESEIAGSRIGEAYSCPAIVGIWLGSETSDVAVRSVVIVRRTRRESVGDEGIIVVELGV